MQREFVENSALLCGVAVAVVAVVSLEVWMREETVVGRGDSDNGPVTIDPRPRSKIPVSPWKRGRSGLNYSALG